MNLSSPLSDVKGVGSKSAEAFALAGIRTVEDLVYFFPRAYEDFSVVTTVDNVAPGKVSLRGKFEGTTTKRVRRGMTVTESTFVDETGKVPVVFFNQAYRAEQIKKDQIFLVSGEFGFSRNRYQITNPSVEAVEVGAGINSGRIVPVYRAVHGLKSTLVRKVLDELRPQMLGLSETLPDQTVNDEKLMPHAEAVYQLHFPDTAETLEKARERLGFEEVLALVLASLKNREANEALESHMITFDAKDAKEFVENLPFTLTHAQRLAAWEAIQNLSSDKPMNRLLQGDVGSGKTVVAGLVGYIAARAGFQTAFMAPTELLARQHAETLSKLLAPLGVTVGLLTGSVKAKARVALYEAIANGSVGCVVGTHALIQDSVVFHKLGFVVIDEQHRFGVEQRQKLLAKADKAPHMLAMTATPIPRSLQLTIYGELDISLLNEKPANRKAIQTQIVSPNSRAQMYEKIEREIESGRQTYVVCPLISGSRAANHESQAASVGEELKSVETEVKRLRQGPFRHREIGLLHGKLKPDEKQAVMADFASGKTDILVSTTVVEVGVDVPNATVMVIEGADTFGLAQLHQLRGRVGRSDVQSYCYLVPSTSRKPSRRLQEMEKSNDGFYLAERDLELRGPGEIYGRAQHGELNLSIARITDTKLLAKVQRAAKRIMADGEDLVQYTKLFDEVHRYRRLTTLN